LRDGKYRFDIYRSDDGVRATIDDGGNLMDLPYQWAFGAGRQAITFVSRVSSEWYVEHYPTWYTVTHSWGATPGHSAVHPSSIAEAAGVLYKIADPQFGIAGCFECHSTGPVSFKKEGEVVVTELGVRCESCHGPGSDHARDPNHNLLKARRTADEMNEFCGRCHRPPGGSGGAIDWNYAWNVRHQPMYLSRSACFLQSRGALSCTTCHDPHAAVLASLAEVNRKCVGCHANASRMHASRTGVEASSDCVDCHMPRVSPEPPLRFTNHWIGIYRMGSKLKPSIQ
jgi:predicted CXXCH cytochrome family protein